MYVKNDIFVLNRTKSIVNNCNIEFYLKIKNYYIFIYKIYFKNSHASSESSGTLEKKLYAIFRTIVEWWISA